MGNSSVFYYKMNTLGRVIPFLFCTLALGEENRTELILFVKDFLLLQDRPIVIRSLLDWDESKCCTFRMFLCTSINVILVLMFFIDVFSSINFIQFDSFYFDFS